MASDTKKIYYCKNCGHGICFDNGVLGKNGRPIPLNIDGTKHDCPNPPPRKVDASQENTNILLAEILRIVKSIEKRLETN